MVVDRSLGVDRGEQIQRELRHERDEQQRRQERQCGDRQGQVEQVVRAAVIEGDRDQPAGIREELANDPRGRAADRVVASVEARRAVSEVRDDDVNRDPRGGDPCAGDRAAGEPTAAGERIPDAEPGDHERDLLARERGEQRKGREGQQPVLVEVPDPEEEQRTGEGDRVEFVERHPLGCRKEQVGKGEAERCSLVARVLPGEPEQRQGSERDHDRLRGQEQTWVRPEPPERREDDEDRIDVGGEARDLSAVQVRRLQQMAVGRRPNGLNHVAEIEAAGLERAVPKDRESCESGRVGGDCGPEQPDRLEEPHGSRPSIRPRQRSPRTRSDA